MARHTWNKVCQRRYPDNLGKLRKAAMDKMKTQNVLDTKNNGPGKIKKEIWNALCDHWVSDPHKKKSEAAKHARMSSPEAHLHSGGSRPFGGHKKRLETTSDEPVRWSDVYHTTHWSKKKGDYVSDHAREIAEKYKAEMISRYGEDVTQHPEVDPDAWLTVTGPPKKKRVHGTGSTMEVEFPSLTSAHSSHSGVGSGSNDPPPDQKLMTQADFTTQIQPLVTIMKGLSEMVEGFVREYKGKEKIPPEQQEQQPPRDLSSDSD